MDTMFAIMTEKEQPEETIGTSKLKSITEEHNAKRWKPSSNFGA